MSHREENVSRQKKKNMCHAERKCLMPKENFSQQNKEKLKTIIINKIIYTVFLLRE